MTTSTSVSTNNDIAYNNGTNANNYSSYPPHSINNNNNNGTPVHSIERPHATGLSSMTISGVSGTGGFVHLTDGCRTLTLPRRSNPSAAAQSKSWFGIFNKSDFAFRRYLNTSSLLITHF